MKLYDVFVCFFEDLNFIMYDFFVESQQLLNDYGGIE